MGLIGRLLGRGSLVVVIDDSEEISILLCAFLRSQGYRAESAPNGVKGLELVHKTSPDLILLDLSMPDMDGKDVLVRLKSDPKTQAIPVVMCTVSHMLKDVEKCDSYGSAGYILKPFDLVKVLEKVESTLCRARGKGI
ncbi:MAG: hypothetical protein A3A86_07925 [Elusimicrobia bacterium RIFCSPLOWO2_01_FULL_60_11]|nr:MAG: hypothetical protein A3A86_07925 [Elusimicrobia bacterium RIFCSPLOWO2_01_FULL_60_11]